MAIIGLIIGLQPNDVCFLVQAKPFTIHEAELRLRKALKCSLAVLMMLVCRLLDIPTSALALVTD